MRRKASMGSAPGEVQRRDFRRQTAVRWTARRVWFLDPSSDALLCNRISLSQVPSQFESCICSRLSSPKPGHPKSRRVIRRRVNALVRPRARARVCTPACQCVLVPSCLCILMPARTCTGARVTVHPLAYVPAHGAPPQFYIIPNLFLWTIVNDRLCSSWMASLRPFNLA